MPGIPEAEPERGPSFEGGLILLKASHLLLTAGMQLLNVCVFVQTKKQ